MTPSAAKERFFAIVEGMTESSALLRCRPTAMECPCFGCGGVIMETRVPSGEIYVKSGNMTIAFHRTFPQDQKWIYAQPGRLL